MNKLVLFASPACAGRRTRAIRMCPIRSGAAEGITAGHRNDIILFFIDNSIKYTCPPPAQTQTLPAPACAGRQTGDRAQAGKGEIEKNHHTKIFGVVVKVETASGKKLKEFIKKSQQYQNDKLNLKSGSRYIVLTVEDNGRGISKDDQQRLFQKFARGNGVYTVYTEGTGLGLYVCKSPLVPLY